MKSLIPSFSKRFILFFTLSITAWSLIGQAIPSVEARFTNPRFDGKTRNYFLDVELTSTNSPEVLFGMNLRFFYDGSLLEFEKLDEFQEGYGILGTAPKMKMGNNLMARFFDFDKSVSFVNGSVQVLDDRYGIELFPHKWVKVFRVCFKVPLFILEEEQFCPSVVWDSKSVSTSESFLPGSEGLVITVKEKDPNTRQVSSPARATGIPFNWNYNRQEAAPYGRTRSNDCISIAQSVSTDDQDNINAKGYALFQNKPNPMNDKTMIEFQLPFAQEGVLKLYDMSGKAVEEIKGSFQAGKNQVEVNHKSWMSQSNVIFYQLETENFTSGVRKMTLIKR